jgi:hypothetical protein
MRPKFDSPSIYAGLQKFGAWLGLHGARNWLATGVGMGPKSNNILEMVSTC